MNEINTFWIAGTPRTGSMWTVNVVREILKRSGFKIEFLCASVKVDCSA